ncbi:hypothetical protein FOMA001_g14470 [Fusarium oxysporum f. sp. matthiolae]|nr:hypothetical protein FOMA001_g14470 [Fusarium oxysporum f. sp. matthiolae]
MGVHDEDGERQLSEPPATREELISLLTKAFTALAKGTENPLGTVALRIHTEGRPKHQIQIRSEVEERSTMRSTCPDIAHVLATVTPLNINISTRAFAFRERGDDWREVGDTDWLERATDWTAPQIRAEAENESNFTGLARLIQKCPRLQDFAYQALGIPFPVFLS